MFSTITAFKQTQTVLLTFLNFSNYAQCVSSYFLYRSGLWNSIDDVEHLVGTLERRAKTQDGGDSPRGWGEQSGETTTTTGPNGSRPVKSTSMTKWDKENLMNMKKRVMKLERRGKFVQLKLKKK